MFLLLLHLRTTNPYFGKRNDDAATRFLYSHSRIHKGVCEWLFQNDDTHLRNDEKLMNRLSK